MNRKNIDSSGLNNVTSERIIGRRELSMDITNRRVYDQYQRQAIGRLRTVIVAASMGM